MPVMFTSIGQPAPVRVDVRAGPLPLQTDDLGGVRGGPVRHRVEVGDSALNRT
jgi:hypothetical protein